VRQAWESWHDGAGAGTIRNRSGELFKPSTLRAYETAMRLRVLPDLGALRLADLRRPDLQDLVDRLLAEGADASTIRNTLMPLRAIFRRAVARGELAVNPTRELELPAVQGRRDRIASSGEAAELLDALEHDRALWATAFYAGLRRGELRGLDWNDVDFAAGVIQIRRGWDDREGAIEPKSRAGRREVPVVAALRRELMEHRLRSGRAVGFVFGRSATDPFVAWTVDNRARRAWKAENKRRAECEQPLLVPLTLHEARHTYASILIAAGVNVKALSTYMGHASITITLDRYGHLMPGHEAEAVEKIDAYLALPAIARD
jgi:integrase